MGGDLFDSLLGIACRSAARHLVVGVLTGGIGNIALLVGDAMDIHDTLDAVDTVSTVHDHASSGGVHFGGGYDDATKTWVNSTTGVSSDPKNHQTP
jgi:hypothetical protein